MKLKKNVNLYNKNENKYIHYLKCYFITLVGRQGDIQYLMNTLPDILYHYIDYSLFIDRCFPKAIYSYCRWTNICPTAITIHKRCLLLN